MIELTNKAFKENTITRAWDKSIFLTEEDNTNNKNNNNANNNDANNNNSHSNNKIDSMENKSNIAKSSSVLTTL